MISVYAGDVLVKENKNGGGKNVAAPLSGRSKGRKLGRRRSNYIVLRTR